MYKLGNRLGILIGLLGFGYIAWVTLTRPDAHFLFKINIFAPFVVITLSLSFITFGVAKTFVVFIDFVKVLALNKASNEPLFDKISSTMTRYSYVSVSLWILYSSIYAFGFEEISINRLISFSLTGILYAFVLSELLIRPAKTKNSILTNKRNLECSKS